MTMTMLNSQDFDTFMLKNQLMNKLSDKQENNYFKKRNNNYYYNNNHYNNTNKTPLRHQRKLRW